MAIDSAQKRASAASTGLLTLLIPDATIEPADRQQIAHVYRGILAEAPPVPVIPPSGIVRSVGAGSAQRGFRAASRQRGIAAKGINRTTGSNRS